MKKADLSQRRVRGQVEYIENEIHTRRYIELETKKGEGKRESVRRLQVLPIVRVDLVALDASLGLGLVDLRSLDLTVERRSRGTKRENGIRTPYPTGRSRECDQRSASQTYAGVSPWPFMMVSYGQ